MASLLFSASAVIVTNAVLQVSLTCLALLPLAALSARAISRRAPSIAHAVLIAVLLLLLAGNNNAAAWVALAGQIIIIAFDLTVRSMLTRFIALIPKPPALVRVERLNREELVPAGNVKMHDRVIVFAGEQIPLDGRLLQHSAKIQLRFSNQTELFAPGEVVIAGSIARSRLRFDVTHPSKDSTVTALHDVAARVAKEIPRPLIRLEQILFGAQVVWSIGFIAWWALSADKNAVAWFSLAGAWWLGMLFARLVWMRTLIVSCKRGVLIGTWEAVRRSRNVRTAILDKTGTITTGSPHIVQALTTEPVSKEDLMRLAVALEYTIDHPIARAIQRAVARERIKVPIAEKIRLLPSFGLTGLVEQEAFAIGNAHLVTEWGLSIPESITHKAKLQEAQGATVVYLMSQEAVLGALVLKDVPRPSARLLVQQLERMRFAQIQLLSGDVPLVSRAIAATIGIRAESVFAHMTADRKKLHVQQMPNLETLAVGDPKADTDMLSVAGLGVGFLGWGPALRERSTQLLVRTPDLTQIPHTIKRLKLVERIWWSAPLTSAVTSAIVLGLLAAF